MLIEYEVDSYVVGGVKWCCDDVEVFGGQFVKCICFVRFVYLD